jgi:hypothetical protein
MDPRTLRKILIAAVEASKGKPTRGRTAELLGILTEAERRSFAAAAAFLLKGGRES